MDNGNGMVVGLWAHPGGAIGLSSEMLRPSSERTMTAGFTMLSTTGSEARGMHGGGKNEGLEGSKMAEEGGSIQSSVGPARGRSPRALTKNGDGWANDVRSSSPLNDAMVDGDESCAAALPLRDGASKNLSGADLGISDSCMEGVCRNAPSNPDQEMQPTGKAATSGVHEGQPINAWNFNHGGFTPGIVGRATTARPSSSGLAGSMPPPRGDLASRGGPQPTNAWNRPPVVAFPSREKLGELPVHEAFIYLRQEVLKGNTKSFVTALAGRLIGRRIPFDFSAKNYIDDGIDSVYSNWLWSAPIALIASSTMTR